MKNTVQKTNKNRSSRLVAFAAIIGLGLGAIFTSAASAVMDTDPVIEVEGFCHLLGPDSSSGVWMSITNDDSWEEDYVIGIFEGLYEDGDMPVDVVEITLEAGETEAGPLVVDSPIATIQVLDLTGAMEDALVYDEVHVVCIPDFSDFDDEDDEESDDGPDFDMDIEVIPLDPEFELDDFDSGIDLPEIDFGGEDDTEEGGEGDEPVVEESGVEDDEEGDESEEPVVEGCGADSDFYEHGWEVYCCPAGVELSSECTLFLLHDAAEPDDEGHEPIVEEGNAPVIVWENTTNDSSLDNNEGSTPVIEEVGKPAKPEIDPEDPKDVGDSDEIASSEGKDSQGKSGLSILWIILIIVGGVVTVGTTTRAIQKNNN